MKICPDCMTVYQDDIEKCCLDGVGLNQIENDSAIGKIISDRYEIVSVVAKGGMGVVYKARHCYMDRDLAIKMLPDHLTTDPKIIVQFKQEAQLISRVKNSHTVTLYDFGVTDSGQPYLVMDYINGISLRALLKKEGSLSLARAHHIFQQALTALQSAHESNVVHKDIKPENIMLTTKHNEGDWVQIVDFGIASLAENTRFNYDDPISKTGVIGSPPYMSPEQCLKLKNIDQRSDIYSLAIVIFEALTGKLPYDGKSAQQMIECHLSAEPSLLRDKRADLSVCGELTRVLAKAMQKNPDDRYQTAALFSRELERAVKSDTSKLKSLKHRAEFFNSEVSDDFVNEVQEEHSLLSWVGFSELIKKVIIIPIIELMGKQDVEPKERFQFYQCPHCSEVLTPNIAFCLSCGRALPSTEVYSKLRSAQRIFAYPKKSQEGQVQESPQVSISRRIKKAERNVVKRRGLFWAFIVTIIFIAIAIFGMPYLRLLWRLIMHHH